MLNRVRGPLCLLSSWADRCCLAAACACLALLTLVMVAQVAARYGFGHALFWAEELCRVLLVQLTFLGAASAYKRTRHPAIGFFELPAPLMPWFTRAAHLACLLLGLCLVSHGLRYVVFLSGQSLATLPLSRAYVAAVLPLCGGLFVLHALSFLLEPEDVTREARP